MKRLIIYGTGYHDIIKLVDAINRNQPTFKILGFINDLPENQNKIFMGYPVLGGKEIISHFVNEGDVSFINNIRASIKNFKKVASVFEETKCKVASLLHPSLDMNYVEYGMGAIIPEGCVVGGNVKIGRYFTCRLKSLISHNVTIGDFVFVTVGVTICGYSVIGDDCFIGAGSTISSGVKIGAGSIIGAGSVVVKDIPGGVVAYGSPAKTVRKVRELDTIINGRRQEEKT